MGAFGQIETVKYFPHCRHSSRTTIAYADKSNLLRALEAAMLLLQRHANQTPRRSRTILSDSSPYLWTRDFPIQFQSRRTSTQTILKLDFLLNDAECLEFKQEIGSSLNGSLPLEIKIGKEQEPEIRLIKSGKGTKSLSRWRRMIDIWMHLLPWLSFRGPFWKNSQRGFTVL